MPVCRIVSYFYSCIWYVVTCTQIVYVVKYYSIRDFYTIKLDLCHIWRLYRQIWISGTNKDMNINIHVRMCIQTVTRKSKMVYAENQG
jgi:hypothetical protein